MLYEEMRDKNFNVIVQKICAEISVTAMWLAVVFLFSLAGLITYLTTRKPKHFPPGPRWWPFLGCAPQIALAQKRTGHLLLTTSEMAKQYGPVLGLKVGQEIIVVVHGFQANKEFLTSEGLAGRPFGDFFDMRTWGKRRGILLVDEEFWYEQRRFFLRQLREFGFGTKNMSTLVEEEAQELVTYIYKAIRQNKNYIFDVNTLFNVPILNSLWKMFAGVRYNAEDEKMRELQGIMNELFRSISMVGTTFSHFPILKYLAPEMSGYNLYVLTHLHIWEFLQKELQYHKKTHNPDEPRDVMDVYLNILQSEQKLHESFSEEQLLATCMDMFMAGSETTSNTLSFCFLYLLLNPDIQKKAQEEIDKIVGHQRVPTLEDRPNMPYVESVVLESLRVFSGRAFTVPHRALQDTYLNGYIIPKDVLVVGNLYDCMMAPDCGFERPDLFKPERFLKDGKISLPHNFVPFGIGKHRCLGETLAKANIFLFVSHLLQKFTFNIIPDEPPLDEWRDGVTPGPLPFKAKIESRF